MILAGRVAAFVNSTCTIFQLKIMLDSELFIDITIFTVLFVYKILNIDTETCLPFQRSVFKNVVNLTVIM